MFSHHEDCVLIAGKGTPTQPASQRSAISYWSIHDNKILRKFRGHSDQVTHLSMSPADDTFLSSSLDGSVRLWTAQSAGCLAEMKLPTEKTEKSPIAAFDSTGLVFAITASMKESAGHYVHLYDARNYSGGAFAELKVLQEDLEKNIQSYISASPDQASTLSKADWTSLSFNKSGNQILVGTALGISIVLDGFEGTIKGVYAGASSQSRPAVSCITPDDQTLLIGNDDGSIQCWNLATGVMQKRLEGHPGPVQCIAANPKFAQFASACKQTALWSW